jgi:hypothetical protein
MMMKEENSEITEVAEVIEAKEEAHTGEEEMIEELELEEAEVETLWWMLMLSQLFEMLNSQRSKWLLLLRAASILFKRK